MEFREAQIGDIAQIQIVRHLVKENTLSDPALVPDKDVAYYSLKKAKAGFVKRMAKLSVFRL